MPAQTPKGNEQQKQTQGVASRQTGYGPGFALTPAAFFRMNPFALMRRMSEEFDRVFGEMGGREPAERTWMPAVEVRQTEGNYLVRAELPGINPGDVKLEITDDAIVMQG